MFYFLLFLNRTGIRGKTFTYFLHEDQTRLFINTTPNPVTSTFLRTFFWAVLYLEARVGAILKIVQEINI